MNVVSSTQLTFFDNFLFKYYGDIIIYAVVFTILFFGLAFLFNKMKFLIKRF
jgi:hypothetical protein